MSKASEYAAACIKRPEPIEFQIMHDGSDEDEEQSIVTIARVTDEGEFSFNRKAPCLSASEALRLADWIYGVFK